MCLPRAWVKKQTCLRQSWKSPWFIPMSTLPLYIHHCIPWWLLLLLRISPIVSSLLKGCNKQDSQQGEISLQKENWENSLGLCGENKTKIPEIVFYEANHPTQKKWKFKLLFSFRNRTLIQPPGTWARIACSELIFHFCLQWSEHWHQTDVLRASLNSPASFPPAELRFPVW